MKNLPRKNQNLIFVLIILSSSVFLSSSILGSVDGKIVSKQPSGEIKVVTSLSIIADWATEIGEGLFTPASEVTGGAIFR